MPFIKRMHSGGTEHDYQELVLFQTLAAGKQIRDLRPRDWIVH